jgi:GTP-binding protein
LKRPEAIFVTSAASPAQFPKDGLPEVAFLGRSNVGKSSLLNALVGARNLARVSSQPGRTRLVNFFRVERIYLADLPGYGYARVSRNTRQSWEQLVSSYLLGRDVLALCVFLVDARHDTMENDETLRAFLDHHRLPYIVAATKSDKLGRGALKSRERALSGGLGRSARAVIPVSATRRTGLQKLWSEIRAATSRPEVQHGH